MAADPPSHELRAPEHWRTLALLSDVHLHAEEPATALAWMDALADCQADALFVLGDLFEVWLGDDQLKAPSPFIAECVAALRRFSQRGALYFMHGNRDFLASQALMDACGASPLPDPTLLVFAGQRLLLSHGDALCLDDAGYLQFRRQVRSAAWQQAFLARPLAEREALARSLREQSRQQQAQRHARGLGYSEVDAQAARQWLQAHQATLLIHGHTHRPGRHELGEGLAREVLSDWDAQASPARAQLLYLRRQASGLGLQRQNLP